MKILTFIFFILLTSCSSINTELRNAVSFGEIIELNKYSEGVDKQLMVRLFSSPIYKEDCFIETHGVCQYQYFISVSTYDEYPETNIYRLNEVGEIKDVKWLGSSGVDTAVIEFKMSKYTDLALKNNSKLISTTKHVRVDLSTKTVKESTLNKS